MLTVEGVHERIACNSGRSTTHGCGQGVVFMRFTLITTHCVLHGLVCCKVYCVSGTCRVISSFLGCNLANCSNPPAPSTTDETPRHNVPKPSVRDIVAIAFEIPLYTADGEGLINCIRVCTRCQPPIRHLAVELSYLEQVDRVHDRVFLCIPISILRSYLLIHEAPYCDTGESAGSHVGR